MNLTYSRLSRDDEKTKYVSIENQKRIMHKYAEENNLIIDKDFEDDGVSGYTMDRPDFNEIKHLIDDNMVDTILVKDLSRLGRHNANVLLFIERCQMHGVRLIAIDDGYDSSKDDDDIIGIKTWYNERYIKDGSKKVRNAMKVMQENAELIQKVPFGYVKDPFVKNKYSIDEEAAGYVKKIFELYADGHGYKKTAKTLNQLGIPTPSMVEHQRRLDKGLVSKVKVSYTWDGHAVQRIIKNDFYIGVLRLRKSKRIGINGVQKRTDEDEHFVFEDAHEPIIPKELFNFVQDLNNKRSNDKTYKGVRKHDNPYACLLECGECGRALTISHYRDDQVISYACRTYRDKGVGYCSAHSINKKELNVIIKDYLMLCRAALADMIESLDSIITEEVKKSSGNENRLKVLNANIETAKNELRAIMERKIKDITANPSMADIISETYDKMQMDKMVSIDAMQAQIKEYENINKNKGEIKRNFKSALDVFDSILKMDELTNRQLQYVVDKIIVHEDNIIEVKLRGELGSIFGDDVVMRMSKEDRIKRVVINYITSVSTFGQVKLLHEIRKTDPFDYEKIPALINEFVEKGYVVQTEKRHKADHPPFICVATKEEMLKGFNICTDVHTIHGYSNHSTDFETYVRISTWIQRYL